MMIDSGFRLVKTDRYDKGEGPIIRSEFFRDRDQSFLFISMSSTSSTTTAAAAAPSNIVDINSLSIEELSSLQQQLNAELNFFNESLGELRNVSSKFGRCQVTLESINPQEKNKLTLIPLSESVYIRAKLPDPDRYLVEIGTGYFVKMNREQALAYFKRKYAFLEAQTAAISRSVIPEKQQVRQMITAALQKKIQAATSK